MPGLMSSGIKDMCGYFKYHMKKAKMGQKQTRDGKKAHDASNDDFGMPGWQSQGQSLANHVWKAFNREEQKHGGKTMIEWLRLEVGERPRGLEASPLDYK
ncbi:hypothetical protein Tco_1142124 [Tanacetum coccineum]